MSHTIRNERTKGFLDHLAKERRTRKETRALKAEPMLFDVEDFLIPSAEI